MAEQTNKVTPEQVARVYAYLISQARSGQMASYTDIFSLVGLKSWGNHAQWLIGQVCGYVSDAEAACERPLLSAIVVTKAGVPSSGFWSMAARNNRYHGTTEAEQLGFWKEECQRVFAEWKQ